MMAPWTPKPRPDWWGWLTHAVIGCLIPILAGRRGGYSAVAYSVIGACIGWAGWELATPALAPVFGWGHAHADLAGMLAGIA